VASLFILLIILLVAQPFFSKMLENFERTALQQVVRQLNVATNLKMAEYVALDKMQQLPEQLTENPIAWLDLDDLGGYGRYNGEVDRLDFEQLEPRHWVYDRFSMRLIYKVEYTELLVNEDPVAERIQFRLILDYSDLNEDGRFDANGETISGIMIVPVYPYHWRQRTDN